MASLFTDRSQDLISYQIEQLEPLKIKECAVGSGKSPLVLMAYSVGTKMLIRRSGELCGAIFLDFGFEKYIITKIGERQWNKIKKPNKIRMMREFETGAKRCFDTTSSFGYEAYLKGVEDDPDIGIMDDQIPVPT